MERRLDGPIAHAERLRDLTDVQVEVVAEHGCLALPTWERIERPTKVDQLCGRFLGTRRRARPALLYTKATPTAPREIRRNLRHPRLQRFDPVSPFVAFPGAGERFLHRVFCSCPTPAHERERADETRVASPQE